MVEHYRKLFLIFLKFSPFIISCCYVIGAILGCACISIYPGWLWGTSLISTLFMIIASHLFQFCFYHRIFIYYPFGIEVLNRIMLWFNITLSIRTSLFLLVILFFIVCLIALINYLKHNEQVKIIKRRSTDSNR
jgi:hypothetical protein